MYQVIHNNVIKWAAEYDGPPFHAILCDPPYHLTSVVKRFSKGEPSHTKTAHDIANRSTPHARQAAGFMNQIWDSTDEQGMGIAFNPATWYALSQHLYPGAFIMAFAGTRGYHRMAVAMEDAGLTIHPALGWLFLCLSEDTEILTEKGWLKCNRLLAGFNCLCYNVDTNEFDFLPIEEVYIYDHDDTAYSIQSDNTDQIVTANHRVIVERNGAFVFREAYTLQQQEIVPILEAVPELPESLCGNGQRPVSQETNLQLELCPSDDSQKSTYPQSKTQAKRQDNSLFGLWKRGLQNGGGLAKVKSANLFKAMQWYFKRNNLGANKSTLDRGTQATGSKTDVRQKQSCLEGWCNLFQDAWQLYKRQVCTLSSRLSGYGSQGWLHYGASSNSSSMSGAITQTLGSSTPYRPQSSQQSAVKPDVIHQQFGPQEIRGNRKPPTTLATVKSIHYRGKVWCVKTPTSTFVARRNGKIFITGNSGFPKATRIDTQLDKQAGVEREKVRGGIGSKTGNTYSANGGFVAGKEYGQPITDLAKTWATHRYGLQALKPAFEFIAVAQVPYSGRPLENIVATGAGSLNIDGARIPTSEDLERVSGGSDNAVGQWGLKAGHTTPQPNGRWPANFLLSCSCDPLRPNQAEHDESCAVAMLDRQSGESVSSGGLNPHNNTAQMFTEKENRPYFNYGDSGPASRMFHQSTWQYEIAERLANADPVKYEPKASSAEREAGLDGFESVKHPEHDMLSGSTEFRHDARHHDGGYTVEVKPSKNNHPTIKPISLTKYLATLLLPPDAYAPRRILVPFAGVGSEMIGCVLAGFEEVVGIEKTDAYIPTCESRLKWWSQWPGWGQTDVDKILANDDEDGQLSFL